MVEGEQSLEQAISHRERPQNLLRQQLRGFIHILSAITPQGEPLLNQEQRANFAKLVDHFEMTDADPDFAQSLRQAVGYKGEDNFPAGKVKQTLRKLAK